MAGPGKAYVHAVNATVADGQIDIEFLHQRQNPTVNGIEIVRIPAATPASLPIRVNVGGLEYLDQAGNLWAADTGFDTGSVAVESPSLQIGGTSDPELYRSARWDTWRAPALTYRFAVPEGTYQVRLHFAETWMGAFAVGKRVFDVQVENQLAIDDLDVFATAGANNAYVRAVTAIVTDGQLDLEFLHQVQNPSLNGIEIVRISATTAPTGPRRYRIVDVGTLGGPTSVDADLNDAGWVTGASSSAAGACCSAFVWNSRAISAIPPPGVPVLDSRGAFINQSGQIAINARGWVTGSSVYNPRSDSFDARHAFLWDGTTNWDLGTLGGRDSRGHAVNDRGWVAGSSTDAAERKRVALWEVNGIRDLGVASGAVQVERMNSSGWIAVNDTVSEQVVLAFVSNGVSPIVDLGSLGGTVTYARDVNAAGWVVGRSQDATGQPRAFRWANGSMEDLNALVDPADPLRPFVTFTEAVRINASGQVLVNGTDRRGGSRAFLLSPED